MDQGDDEDSEFDREYESGYDENHEDYDHGEYANGDYDNDDDDIDENTRIDGGNRHTNGKQSPTSQEFEARTPTPIYCYAGGTGGDHLKSRHI